MRFDVEMAKFPCKDRNSSAKGEKIANPMSKEQGKVTQNAHRRFALENVACMQDSLTTPQPRLGPVEFHHPAASSRGQVGR